jgi:hypothetical protein
LKEIRDDDDRSYTKNLRERKEYFQLEQLIIGRDGFVNKQLFNSVLRFIREGEDANYRIC